MIELNIQILQLLHLSVYVVCSVDFSLLFSRLQSAFASGYIHQWLIFGDWICEYLCQYSDSFRNLTPNTYKVTAAESTNQQECDAAAAQTHKSK